MNDGLNFSASELELIRQKNFKLTQVELDAFIGACKRYQLNPLANQIYARLQEKTERNPRAVTYTCGIDGYRLIADRTGAYAGNDDPVYDSEENPQKATVTVYKMVEGQRCAFTSSARWSQYYPGDRQGFMWKKMPHLMLGKCAEALAIRKAFPAELSGLYTNEEMHQADAEPKPEPEKPATNGNGFKPGISDHDRYVARAQKRYEEAKDLKELLEVMGDIAFKMQVAKASPELRTECVMQFVHVEDRLTAAEVVELETMANQLTGAVPV
jgi:phage recombination protein Bet